MYVSSSAVAFFVFAGRRRGERRLAGVTYYVFVSLFCQSRKDSHTAALSLSTLVSAGGLNASASAPLLGGQSWLFFSPARTHAAATICIPASAAAAGDAFGAFLSSGATLLSF